MPIRPENLRRYPADWRKISRRIRFGRAASRCECVGECGLDHTGESELRCAAIHHQPHPVTRGLVVLTVAHLNHTPEDCREANLKAMCQRCHNRLDLPTRIAGRRRRARAGMATRDLFGDDG